jgi:hypothetical protein
MQDSKNFGWEINGDINFNWKTLLENKVRTQPQIQAQFSTAAKHEKSAILPVVLIFSFSAD